MSPAGTALPHAPGFIANETPRIVTSRFEYEDSYTLERYLATGGYEGLRSALGRPPAAVHTEVRDATVLGRGGRCQMGLHAGRRVAAVPRGQR